MTETERALLAAMAMLLVHLVKQEGPFFEHQPIGATINRVESLAADLFEPPVMQD